jgi:DNA-nicking Smr family endonuclease
MDIYYKENEIVTVDLHCMREWEAMLYLSDCIEKAGPEIKEVLVIHGYKHGDKLARLVRNEFHNKRILRKFLSLNPGRTSLILK